MTVALRGVRLGALLWMMVGPSAWAQDTLEIAVVATTDVHGRAMHWDYVRDRVAPWGLTRAATVVDSLRRVMNGRVLLVDAGDLLQGNLSALFFGTVSRGEFHPVIDALNAMQYDVVTLGNHDFDFGLEALDNALGQAQFQVVSGNIYRLDREELAFRDHAVLDRGGVRVGVTGFTTPGTMLWNRDRLRADGARVIRPILSEAGPVLDELAARGVDLKVVLMHSGLGGPSSYPEGEVGAEHVSASLATLAVKPDLVVVGHSHRSIRDTVIGGVHFVQPDPGAGGLAVVRISFVRGPDGSLAIAGVDAAQVPLGTVEPDAQLVRRLAQSHDAVRGWANTPIGNTVGEWSARYARAGDTPLIDFVNEVQRAAAGAQLSATAVFDPGAGLPEGGIRLRHVFGFYPFENSLKAVRITGSTLKVYLEHSAEYFRTYAPGESIIDPRVPGYDFDIISGVEYVLDLRLPPGSRVRQLVHGGRLVEADDTFTLALNSHRQTGAGGYDMLVDLPVVYDRGENIRDLLVTELGRRSPLDSASYFVSSWRVVPPTAARAVRAAFEEQPLLEVERTVLRILATSDLHGALEARVTDWSEGREVGGAVALKGWVDSLAGACDCVTVQLDAGDQLGGSVVSDRLFGQPVVDVFNLMRYDAAVVGGRDLAWGVDTLRARMARSGYQWLAANAALTERRARPGWAREWTVVDRGGVRVGVIGVTGAVDPAVEAGGGAEPFRLEDPAAAVRRVLPQVRSMGVNVVVVVAHLPATCDEGGACRGALIDLVRQLEPGSVDLVIGGHSDAEATATINRIAVLLPGSYGLSLGVADIVTLPSGEVEVRPTIETAYADAVPSDIEVASIVSAAARDLDVPIAEMRFAATRREEESGLGRLVADAYRNAARADVALVLNQDIHGALPRGTVTYRDVYAVQPVQHTIVRLAVRGRVLYEMLEHVVRGDKPIAHVAGLRVWYDPTRRPGDRVRRIRFPDGEDVRRDRTYTLGVSEGVASGAAGFEMLAGVAKASPGLSDLEALADYLRRIPPPVEAPREARFLINE